MKRIWLFLIAACWMALANAQSLLPTTWTAYGLTFDAPRGILVEEDTEDTYLLNNSRFYISLHSLDSDNIVEGDLKELLKGLADDDNIQEQTGLTSLDLKQFHCFYLKGRVEEDACCYACFMTKDAGSVFCLSIICQQADDKLIEKMLKSFKMEE